jgi:diketogulonate reductase-like aldo/keto reductase
VSSQSGNEAEIGAALLEVFSDWLVNRPDVWITGKVWPSADKCPSPGEVRAQAKAVLKDLKVDYLDLYLLPAHGDAAGFKVSNLRGECDSVLALCLPGMLGHEVCTCSLVRLTRACCSKQGKS